MSYMQLLEENSELTKQLSRLRDVKPQQASEAGNENAQVVKSPLERELEVAEAKIADLAKALHDKATEVELIDEKAKLAELNMAMAERVQKLQEDLLKTQTQLQDSNDKADLLEFRVFELEEDAEKA